MTNSDYSLIDLHGITAVDLGPAIDSVQEKYGKDAHRDPRAAVELCRIWGGSLESSAINPHGVFQNLQCGFRLTEGRTKCAMEYAVAPSGLVVACTSYMTSTQGRSSTPTVWNRVAFRSAADAISAAASQLTEKFRAIENHYATADSTRREVRRMIGYLADGRLPQLSLF